MLRIVFCVFILSNWLSHQYGDCAISVEPVENSIIVTDHLEITRERLVIDDAISEKQLKVLDEFMNRDPVLESENPTTISYSGGLAKYSYKDMSDIYHYLHEATHKVPKTGRSSKSHLKEVLFWKEMVAIELRIIDYAESFFRVRLLKKSSAIFVRKRIKVDIPSEVSPSEVNGEEGWVVGIHADSCTFDSASWTCSPPRDDKEREELTTRHVSVVMFLNELSDDAGGELVFLDPLQQSTEDESSHSSRNTLSKTARETVGSDVIKPPSRDSIRRELRRERQRIRRGLMDTSDDSRKSQYVKAIHVPDKHINYTVVLPKARRLAMFNSSAANIHAVTNLLNETDRRFTYFMFLRIID